MTIILIALLTAVCVLFILLRIEAMQLDTANHLLERREEELKQYEKRIYEHDCVESWHSRYRHDMVRDVAEMVYADGVLMKRIDGIADVPVAYQHRHDIYSPMRLDGTKVLGNKMGSTHVETCRMTSMDYDRYLKRIGGR